MLATLQPLWDSGKHSTAGKLRGWVREALSWAIGHGHITTNYAGEVIDGAVPKVSNEVEHHDAVPYADVAGVLARVQDATGTDAVKRALMFTVLTAARSGETRGATWAEIDLDTRTWTIPAGRMKAGREHVVPLSDDAVRMLGTPSTGYVFEGRVSGSTISRAAMPHLLKRVCQDCTVHGFRSSFRDWATEDTDHMREVAEHALAHVVGGAVERAYARGTMLDKRRELMADWASYIMGGNNDTMRSHSRA